MSGLHNKDIGYQIQQIAHFMKQLQNERLTKEDLSLSHANVLFVLYENDGITQTKIQRELGIKASSLSKLIDILINKDLVTRESVKNDARSKVICLTELGREKKDQLYKVTNEIESELTELLTDEEVGQLSNMLSKVRKKIQIQDL